MTKIQDELMAREKGFWDNLDNPDFYQSNMAQDALAVINGDVKTRDDAVAMTREMPVKFENIRFENPRFVPISDDTAAVTYEATAKMNSERYAATITSVYTKRNGDWLLALTTHAQRADQTATTNGKQKATAGATSR